MNQTFNVSENARVEIRNCKDLVTIMGWDDTERIEVDCPARQEGNTVVIENQERVSARVPRAATVLIAQCDADVRVENVDGNVELGKIDGDVVLRNLQKVSAHDLESDLAIRDVQSLELLERCEGDVAGREIGALNAERIGGDLALNSVGAIKIRKVDGDMTVSQAKGSISIEKVEGDFVVSGLRGALDAREIEGDAVVSVAEIAPIDLRAERDVVLTLPEGANAELELDAPHGDLVANADIETADEDKNTGHLSGKLGTSGEKIRVESTKGDIVLRVGGARQAHMRGRVRVDAREFSEMGQRIGRQVRESLRESIRESVHASIRQPMREAHEKIRVHHRHEREQHREENKAEEKPRGPAAGSAERQAILDAIARGELGVDDAIKKLRGEE